MPLPRPPPRGTEEQPGRRPLRGPAAARLLLQFKSRSSGWRFRGKQNLTLAGRSDCFHGRAVGTAGFAKPQTAAVKLLGETKWSLDRIRAPNSIGRGQLPCKRVTASSVTASSVTASSR